MYSSSEKAVPKSVRRCRGILLIWVGLNFILFVQYFSGSDGKPLLVLKSSPGKTYIYVRTYCEWLGISEAVT